MNDDALFSSEEWSEICDFPVYAVSSYGRVRKESTGRLLTPTMNSRGIPIVGLMGPDKKQVKRSLPLLVADAFLPRISNRPAFDTPINLDGDRTNNHISNLCWRPLWFSRKFHAQFERKTALYPNPIEDVETRIFYADSREAATIHGLLESEIRLSMFNNTYVFPTGQIFRDAVV